MPSFFSCAEMEAVPLVIQDVTSPLGRVKMEERGIGTETGKGGTDTGTRTGIVHARIPTPTPTRARRRGMKFAQCCSAMIIDPNH